MVAAASMGPRLFSRGKTYVQVSRDDLVELQWGRGFSAAERRWRNEAERLREQLQWGRGFSAAERTDGTLDIDGCDVLQWGRGFSAAESSTSNASIG